MFKYVINLTNAEVQMCDGKVNVPVKGFSRVSLRQSETEEVIECIQRGWISDLRVHEPSEAEIEKLTKNVTIAPKIEFETPAVVGTTEFPKNMKKPKDDKSSTFTSVALGKGEQGTATA